jgi:hypothetical protein
MNTALAVVLGILLTHFFACSFDGAETIDNRSSLQKKTNNDVQEFPELNDSNRLSVGSSTPQVLEDMRQGTDGADSDPLDENPSQNQPNDQPDTNRPPATPTDDLKASDLCSQAAPHVKLTEEHAFLCSGDQPTALLNQLFQQPYKGQADTSNISKLIRSEDRGGISHLVVANSSLYEGNMESILAKRKSLSNLQVSAGDASLKSSLLQEIAPSNGADLGGFRVKETLDVNVIITTITDASVSEIKFKTISEDKLVMSQKSLKQGEQDNSDNTRINQLSYWLAMGEKTLIVTVVYQEANNQGFHSMAETTTKNIAQALAKKAYDKLSN